MEWSLQRSAAARACRLVAAARDLFKDLQRSAQPVPPLAFWLGLRSAFPQFNQQNNQVRNKAS